MALHLCLRLKRSFSILDLKYKREGELEGEWLAQIVGLNEIRTAYVFLRMPDGQANVELIKFRTPSDQEDIRQPLANTPGLRHIAFVVGDIEAIVAKLKKNGREIFSEIQYYEESYKLCYVRRLEGIIFALAEPIR